MISYYISLTWEITAKRKKRRELFPPAQKSFSKENIEMFIAILASDNVNRGGGGKKKRKKK